MPTRSGQGRLKYIPVVLLRYEFTITGTGARVCPKARYIIMHL